MKDYMYLFPLLLQTLALVWYLSKQDSKVKALISSQIELKIQIKDVESKVDDEKKECKETAKRIHDRIERRVKKEDCIRQNEESERQGVKVCELITTLSKEINEIKLSLARLEEQLKKS